MMMLWGAFFVGVVVVVTAMPRTEVLDDNGVFTVTWEMDMTLHVITFTLDVKTTAWVGFGVSNNDSMVGADVVVGGVFPNGSTYFTDRHGVSGDRDTPLIDDHEDWKFLEGTEKGGRTRLKFSRICDTKDAQDVPFSMSSQRFLWAVGGNDTVDYRRTFHRGVYPVNIFDYPPPPFDPSKFEKLPFTMNVTLPAKETISYYMLHRSPKYATKTSIVAVIPQIRSYFARLHTHHMAIYKCQVPKKDMNTETFFEPHRLQGLMDEDEDKAKLVDMSDFCGQLMYSWSRGARNLYFPEGVGLANGEGGRYEYYMMEMSFKNPKSARNVRFETGVNFYITTDALTHDVGLFNLVKQEKFFFIPPGTSNFHVSGQCSAECTNNLPPQGINVFAIQLHAHTRATKVSIHHVRDGTELPLIATDQNFNATFQNIRNRKPVNILPGDQLFIDCGYRNEGRVKFGGSLDEEEMCDSLLYYYPRTPFSSCGSENLQSSVFPSLGISIANTSRSNNDTTDTEEDDPLVTSNSPSYPLVGVVGFKEYLFQQMNWTEEVVKESERSQFKGDQGAMCVFLDPSNKTDSDLPVLRKVSHVVHFPTITRHSNHAPSSLPPPHSSAIVITLVLLLINYYL